MSEEFKPLAEQISERMVNLLNDNRSIFTKPMKEDGTSQFVMPINAKTKQNYTSATALVLLMQNRRDPRWLSYDQARFNKTPVKKGAHGTLIEFMSDNKLQQKVENGQPAFKENGKPKMERVKLDEPVKVEAWLFNGKDLDKLKELTVRPNPQTPMERAQAIIDNSGVNILKDEGWETHYSRDTDFIYTREAHEFEKPELYFASVLHELAHATGHENRLNRPRTDEPVSDQLVREELRANLASILISADLNLPYDLGEHAAFTKDWSRLLTDEPMELFNAANDAQKIADFVMGLEPKLAQKQDTAKAQSATKLEVDMEIPYKDTVYKVIEKMDKNAVKVQDMNTTQKIRITPSMGLYKSLLNEVNNPTQAETLEQEQEEAPELELAEEETRSTGRKR
ncbi:MAG: DUF1738 domain-containing protein [Bacteroidetes bacterium]|nr:DUF1738 domain-containing protein [Bacteroidota bacterium]